MRVKLLIFSLTILGFCLTQLSKCLINVKQMVYCIFADNPIDDDDDQDNPANDDVDDQGRGGGSVCSTWLPASLTFPERQVHPLLLSCPRCQQVITGFKDDEAQSVHSL